MSHIAHHFSPSESFWSDFVRDRWERMPARFTRFFDPPIADAEALFEAVTAMPDKIGSDRFWMAKRNPVRSREDFKFVPMDRFGPRPADESLGGFFARAQKEFLGHPFGINVHRLQLADPALWFRLRAFIGGLTNVLGGLPTQKWELDMFFGTYQATPFGIHQDNASVFSFGVLGRRRFCFWPNDYFAPADPALHTPDAEAFAQHLDRATIMELGPGDMVYWPSSHWHVVLSDGEPSATVQVSAYFGVKLSELLSKRIEKMLASKLPENEAAMFPFSSEGTQPSNIDQSRARLEEVIAAGELDRQLRKSWLKRRSAGGFTSVPDRKETEDLSHDRALSLVTPDCLGWLVNPEGTLKVFANGLSAETPDSAAARGVLEALSRGESRTLSDWVNDAPRDEPTLRKLFSDLDRCRAFSAGS